MQKLGFPRTDYLKLSDCCGRHLKVLGQIWSFLILGTTTAQRSELLHASGPAKALTAGAKRKSNCSWLAGTILSVAPLLGASPSLDASHKRWLHVHVRPHARGMLKTVKVSPQVRTSNICQAVTTFWLLLAR